MSVPVSIPLISSPAGSPPQPGPPSPGPPSPGPPSPGPPSPGPPSPGSERLAILVAPDKALRAKARRVGPEDLELIRSLLPKLFATMYAAPGIGLAAPQVGVGLRLAIVDLQPDDKPAPMVLLNPEVVAASKDEVVREEGCLSLPGHYADVSRPARVRVRYEDEAGARHEMDADGLLAACLQHELDHLDGVLFVDHLTPLRRNMILRKLAKEQKAKAG